MDRLPMSLHASARLRPAAKPAILLALVAAFLVSGCHQNQPVQASSPSTAADPPSHLPSGPPANTPPTPSPTADDHDPLHFTTTGPLVAEQQADLSFDRDGRVVEVLVQVGDRVKLGQLLARLDDREAQADCAAKDARVASLKDQVKEWQAEQKVEEADLRRADFMRAQHIRSEEDWEHVKFKLDETIQEVSRYQHDEIAAEADLQAARVALDQTRLVAPFNGVIGRSSIRIAQQVKKGDVLFWITAEAPLEVLFTVPESMMASFHKGSRLLLTTNDYPQLRQSAAILRVSPVVDPASGSIQVVGLLNNSSPLLKPGITMQVQLQP